MTGAPGPALLVRCPPRALDRVVANLLDNAVRETAAAGPGGHVRVRAVHEAVLEGEGEGETGSTHVAEAAGEGASVGVSVGVGAGGGGAVCLEVVDRCGGIPEADVPHLFQTGWRGGRARTPDGGGAGLGLAVVAALVSAAGGTVAVHPVPGGCAFRVRLPAAGPPPG